MKIKTSKLEGIALDWAVAKCEGKIETGPYGTPEVFGGYLRLQYCDAILRYTSYTPSTYWALGGPIIERELIDIQAKFNSGSNIVPKGQWYWQASTVNEDDIAYWLDGVTPLIAAMRCYVANKLGDEVEIPDELL